MEELILLNSSLPHDHVGGANVQFDTADSFQTTKFQYYLIARSALFGVMFGLIIAVIKIFTTMLIRKHNSLKRPFNRIISKKLLLRFTILVILALSLPWVTLFLSIAVFYKCVCSILIRLKDANFVGFLDSLDVFWCLEDDATKSVINILGVIESESPEILVEHIKDKLQSIITTNATERMFYRRIEEYGFYYWRRCPYIDIDQYVRIVDVYNYQELNESDLEEVMSELSYQPLPFNDEGLFQILITNQKMINANNDNQKGDYGIIFRIHHSVGDGVALIQFLCQSLADNKENRQAQFCMPETYKTHSVMSISDILSMMSKLIEMPLCFIDGILREPDISHLHGQKLLGKKIYKWIETEDNLFHIIKEIKENCKIFNFSEILMTALSRGIRYSFIKEGAPIPDNVAVILPIRFSKIEYNNGISFENNFTVSILDLPIKGDEVDVCNRFKLLRKSADPLTNHYFLKICGLLPKEILCPMFNSSQATMVFSNMPGPNKLSICGGALKSLVFFVPNSGTTGLGVTALCYGGVLRLSAMADGALVTSSGQLGVILEGMVDEIIRLHDKYVKKYMEMVKTNRQT